MGLTGAQAVGELEAAGELFGHRHFAPALGAALEGADAKQRLFQVDVGDSHGQRLGDTAAAQGQGESEGLHFGSFGLAGDRQEAVALVAA